MVIAALQPPTDVNFATQPLSSQTLLPSLTATMGLYQWTVDRPTTRCSGCRNYSRSINGKVFGTIGTWTPVAVDALDDSTIEKANLVLAEEFGHGFDLRLRRHQLFHKRCDRCHYRPSYFDYVRKKTEAREAIRAAGGDCCGVCGEQNPDCFDLKNGSATERQKTCRGCLTSQRDGKIWSDGILQKCPRCGKNWPLSQYVRSIYNRLRGLVTRYKVRPGRNCNACNDKKKDLQRCINHCSIFSRACKRLNQLGSQENGRCNGEHCPLDLAHLLREFDSMYPHSLIRAELARTDGDERDSTKSGKLLDPCLCVLFY